MDGQSSSGTPVHLFPNHTKTTRPADLSRPVSSAGARGAGSLIAGAEGGHLSALFAPRSGVRLSARDYAEELARTDVSSAGDPAVYIHLPFCPSRCLNCSRNTSVAHDSATIDRYIDSLDREMALYANRLGEGVRLAQLHLGGGTPNYLTEPQLLRLMDTVERYFKLDDETEMSLEASPSRSSAAQLQLMQGLGFDTIKFQVRDLDVDVQKAIGRFNSIAVLEDVFRNARDAGIQALGMDLVYGLPEQTMASINRTADALVELAPDRISCRAFARRSDAFPHQRALTPSRLPSLADRLILFNTVIERMDAANYLWVGLDKFVRQEDAFAVSQKAGRLFRNWIGYNLHGGPTVLGFGASAISEIGAACAQNFNTIEDWQAALGRGELPVRAGVRQTENERAHRRAVSGLFSNMRLDDEDALSAITAGDTGMEQLQQQGLISLDGEGIAVTPSGRVMLHHACAHRDSEYDWVSGW